MRWEKNTRKIIGYDSDCGNFRIIKAQNGKWRLIAFNEPETEGGSPWWADFVTLEDAKRHAESMK